MGVAVSLKLYPQSSTFASFTSTPKISKISNEIGGDRYESTTRKELVNGYDVGWGINGLWLMKLMKINVKVSPLRW